MIILYVSRFLVAVSDTGILFRTVFTPRLLFLVFSKDKKKRKLFSQQYTNLPSMFEYTHTKYNLKRRWGNKAIVSLKTF